MKNYLPKALQERIADRACSVFFLGQIAGSNKEHIAGYRLLWENETAKGYRESMTDQWTESPFEFKSQRQMAALL
jgi:hypothetical protein